MLTVLRGRKTYAPSRAAAAVVTGAARGIGSRSACEIRRRGGSVIGADIDEGQLKATAKELGELGEGRVIPYVRDVRRQAGMKTLFDEAEAVLVRPVSPLVNNASMAARGNVGEMHLEDWHVRHDNYNSKHKHTRLESAA